MSDEFKIIARIHNGYKTKFGVPRQSGIARETKSRIVFEKEYRDPNAFRRLDEYSHLWLIWKFSESECENWSPTVRPPRLGGDERVGVFATRSPFRPNPIGLTCVKLEKIDFECPDAPVLTVSGADIMDSTPIYDIKPYIPYADSRPDAVGGFADGFSDYSLKVCIPGEIKEKFSESFIKEVTELLKTDPRPAYQKDEDREYGVLYYDKNIKFKVKDDKIFITDIELYDNK